MGAYTKRDVKEINDLMGRWKMLEHDGWLLVSFDRTSARYGMNMRGEFIKYVTIDANIIDFLQGVDPDIKDMTYGIL
jgi:hypothetical protein